MSINIMSRVWGLDLKPIPKLILLALSDNANEEGICWPGLKYLERKTSLARSTIVKYIAELEASGVLQKRVRYSSHGLRATNLYQVWLNNTKSEAHTSLSPSLEPPLVRPADLSSSSLVPKSSINHHKEPIRQVANATQPVSASKDVKEIFQYWQDRLVSPP